MVYNLVRRHWKAKLNTSRPTHRQQDSEAVAAFPTTLAQRLRTLAHCHPHQRRRLWLEDESRFGLKPICRRRITASGVAPVAVQQWRFEWVWLYGLVEPLTGEAFFWAYSHLDQACFEHFLSTFACQYPDEQHLIHTTWQFTSREKFINGKILAQIGLLPGEYDRSHGKILVNH